MVDYAKIELTRSQSNWVRSRYTESTVVSATLWWLYVDDVRSGFTQKSADYYFDSLFILCLIIFFIEFVVSWVVKKGYAFSFFFFLDFAAMISVVMNINFLMDLLSVTIKLPDFSYIAQSGRAGRAGTKVGRLMRIVRMIRMIRVAKFYKAAK